MDFIPGQGTKILQKTVPSVEQQIGSWSLVNSSWFSGGGEEGGKVEGDIRKEEDEQKRFLPDSLA